MSAPVLYELRPSGVLVATLNSEKSLNALSLDMIESLHQELDMVANDPKVSMIFLQGAGPKAFCAGGDIRKLYESMRDAKDPRDNPYAASFFEQEYRLDYKIHVYPKPVLCWGHGIVMGGGLGLFAGASCRVVTESSKIAMPEITIGLYPDVGATYFLNQMPKGVGLYLALTATRMSASDALYVGLADYAVASASKEELLKALDEIAWNNDSKANQKALEKCVQQFAMRELPPSAIESHLEFIQSSCGEQRKSVEEIAAFWASSPVATSDDWAKIGLMTFMRGSPTSAKVMFEQLRRGKNLDLKQAFLMEAGLTIQFAWHHDFKEGVRALLIDKDNNPRWSPSSLEGVSAELVAEHFDAPWGRGPHPLSDLPEPN